MDKKKKAKIERKNGVQWRIITRAEDSVRRCYDNV
jgi:hypothetical protein